MTPVDHHKINEMWILASLKSAEQKLPALITTCVQYNVIDS